MEFSSLNKIQFLTIYIINDVKLWKTLMFYKCQVISGIDEYIDGRFNVISGSRTVLFSQIEDRDVKQLG